MRLDLSANSRLPVPTFAELLARIEDLPYGLCGLVRGALNRPGVTAAELLVCADGCDEGARETREFFPKGCPEASDWERAAQILRDAAPLFPHPPRLPADPAPIAGWLQRTRPGIRR